MKTNLGNYTVYPSQLTKFKEKAKKLEWALNRAKLLNSKPSAFVRNDRLARALGYKSHSDLVNQSKAKQQADTGQPLILFSDDMISKSIAQVFWKESNASEDLLLMFQTVCNQLGNQEVGWEPGVIKLSENQYKLYITLSLNVNGIEFINIADRYMIDLDWDECSKILLGFGFEGKRDLITFLEEYVDMPILIEGMEDFMTTGELIEKGEFSNLFRPLIRALYYEAEDKHRSYINNLPQNINLMSFL